jgi:hypothetical protein
MGRHSHQADAVGYSETKLIGALIGVVDRVDMKSQRFEPAPTQQTLDLFPANIILSFLSGGKSRSFRKSWQYSPPSCPSLSLCAHATPKRSSQAIARPSKTNNQRLRLMTADYTTQRQRLPVTILPIWLLLKPKTSATNRREHPSEVSFLIRRTSASVILAPPFASPGCIRPLDAQSLRLSSQVPRKRWSGLTQCRTSHLWSTIIPSGMGPTFISHDAL